MSTAPPAAIDDRLARTLEQVERSCHSCSACVDTCTFLRRYGSPAAISRKALSADFPLENAFACNLCQLCTAICTHKKVAPHELFLEIRRACVRNGSGIHPEHQGLTEFEKSGTSKQLTWAGLPFGCRTVFFPGCTLCGSRPAAVRKAFEILQHETPDIGVVLDCCSKPSHDLGRDNTFRSLFGELCNWLLDAGIEEVLTGCPSCQQLFEQYGAGLKIRSIYEALLENRNLIPRSEAPTPVKLHDPCTARFATTTQQAVRELAVHMGLEVQELPHHGTTTLCCGKGGAAHHYAPSIAGTWLAALNDEATSHHVTTYCGSCQARFHETFKSSHLLDFLAHPAQAAQGEIKPPIPALFHINRLRLKHYFRRHLETSHQRERTIDYPEPG
ncbi:MAG: (Fe-S)-binding protein [Desulfuromonas sp.]|nr:MAG: (Fe-S)-binding protein [Desulfuromonas sp.]